ncbi:MAG: hypothetical protein NTX15_00335 [Candidatus Kapabacteria bacterium]|nr:hypothetical protein [Candidatus Kapabacteria bacterium]
MAKYKFDGRFLKTSTGVQIGEFERNSIKDEGGAKIGILDGTMIKNARGIRLASFDGVLIRDPNGNQVGQMKDVARTIDGTTGMPLIAMWWFFVR